MRHYYSEQRKAIILKRLLPPFNESISKVSRDEGIPKTTLFTWKQKQGELKKMVPQIVKKKPQFTAETRFAILVETATMSEAALSVYCREKGLYPEQVKAWKAECLSSMAPQPSKLSYAEKQEAKKDQKRIRELEKELRKKEKALAEAAALLMLRKKLRALYGEDSEDD